MNRVPAYRVRRTCVALLLALLAVQPRQARAQATTEPAPPSSSSSTTTNAAPQLQSRFGVIEDHGGVVWYRLKPPFFDPNFQAFSFAPQKNTGLALAEVVGINFLMWQVSYWAGNEFSKISLDTIGQNFRKGWIVDTDGYWVNQFGHPLEGSLFYSAARSTGHNFYESFGAAFLGSFIWEQFMEVQSPSVNDQITTPVGGTLLGEVMYRMHRLILDSGGEKPDIWREIGAFVVNPVAGFNRLTSGDKYRGEMLLPPSWMGHFHLGMVIGGSATNRRTGAVNPAVGPWGSIGFNIVYGVPGTPDLRLRQPFDHFDVDFTWSFAGQEEPTAELKIRGLVVGDTITGDESFGGLWGLFTSYDITGVPIFKASGVGVGPGVALMKRWGWFELHGTATAEFMPWGGGGSIEALYVRDYHYGPGAKGTLELSGHFGDRAILDLVTREYLISGAYATGSYEDITYAKTMLTVRLYGPHAVTGAWNWGRRHASFPNQPDVSENVSIWSAYYTLLTGW